MTGVVTGAEIFVYLSYVLSGMTLLLLSGYALFKLSSSKKRLDMINPAQAKPPAEAD